MNGVGNIALSKSRLALIAISSFFVAIPQIIWSIIGYGGTVVILADSAFIVGGFVLMLMALTTPPTALVRRICALFSSDDGKEGLSKYGVYLPYIAFAMALYILVPYGISRVAGYTPLPLWLLIVLATVSIIAIGNLIYTHKHEITNRQLRWIDNTGTLLVLLAVWTFAFWYGSPKVPTDEFALDFYSAHLFLGGANPYIPTSTANVFSYLAAQTQGFPYGIVTPYTNGGFVTNLTYPGLAVMAYIPANLIGAYPTATLIPFYAILPLIIYTGYSKSNLKSIALLPTFLLVLNPSYLIQVSLGYPDILWVIFASLSLIFYKRPVTSGLMMGLAISVKQIPWLLIPFLVIFIYRELGKKASLKWTLTTLSGFLLVNAVFILQAPSNFFGSLIEPELQNLVGIGFGPSQFSFLDIIPISRSFFTFMVVLVFVASIVIYFVYYRNLKYAFLAFPVIIFLFNYRLLLSYVLFWPIMALLLPLIIDKKTESSTDFPHFPKLKKLTSIKKIVVPVVLVAIVSAPVFYHFSGQTANNQIDIENVGITDVLGNNITEITVTLTTNSVNITGDNMQFRIMSSSAATNMNGYLWQTVNYTEVSNGTYLFHISPLSSSQSISWNGNYRLLAYYGAVTAAKTFKLKSGAIS